MKPSQNMQGLVLCIMYYIRNAVLNPKGHIETFEHAIKTTDQFLKKRVAPGKLRVAGMGIIPGGVIRLLLSYFQAEK